MEVRSNPSSRMSGCFGNVAGRYNLESGQMTNLIGGSCYCIVEG